MENMSLAMETIAPGLLIAAPMLKDPNFDRTVVLMCIHNEEGAMGLIINRPAPLSMHDILTQLGFECTTASDQSAMVGGPVALDSGLLLYQVEAGSARREDELMVTDDLRLCPNRDLLNAIGKGEGPHRYHMFLGHAGWGPGQLESELSQGAWIPASMQIDLIFTTPMEERWQEALRREGVLPAQFSHSRPQA
jgi:putative transcriptional regulator